MDLGQFYLEYEYYIASTQLILAMLGMGATLRVRDFVEVLRQPRGILTGIATQLVAMPLLALALGRGFGLAPGLAVGLILVAAVPGGTMSNVLTFFARGNVPLSISLTAVTTIACLVTTPALLGLLGADYLPGTIEMPTGQIALEIVVSLVGPLAIGMGIGNLRPAIREVFSRTCIRASLAAIVVLVAGATAAERVDVTAHGAGALAAVLLLSVGGLIVGGVASRVLTLDSSDQVAVGIEAAYRNINLALLVKASVFPALAGAPDPFADAILFVALAYGGLAFFVVLPPLLWHRRRRAPAWSS
jgi:BASS family bile acid:Na+ symporter